MADRPWETSRVKRLSGPALFVGVVGAVWLGLAGVGLPQGASRLDGMVSAVSSAVAGFITPTLYLLAAMGLGRPMAAWLVGGGGSRARVSIQLALGVGVMLWASHAMGVLGLLSEHGPLGPGGSRLAAWGIVGAGLALLMHQVARGDLRPEKWPVFPLSMVLWAPAIGLLLIASCNPPGSLWKSEFGAYDALSYHLQLPKEWVAGPAGRLWPADHNVYSYLPSYVEAAFAHLGAMSIGFGGGGGAGAAVERMLGEFGAWVYACQLLHAGMSIIGALLTARLVRALAERAGSGESIARLSGLGAGALFLGTPWTIVCGSLAYNELAMLAMMAGAMLAVIEGPASGSAWRRGACAGLLTGIACSAKPTALVMVAPVVAIVMLVEIAPHAGSGAKRRMAPLAAAFGACAVAGIVAIGPWLVRNSAASGGNPVFPFASATLGSGHWTDEQVARYARAHAAPPGAGIGERFGLLFSARGAQPGEQARGLGHEQWAYVPWMALASMGVAIGVGATRKWAVVMGTGMAAQIGGWMALTHLQSRFLMPMLVPMSVVFGLGVAALLMIAGARARRSRGAAPVPGEDDDSRRPLPVFAAMVVAILPLTVAGWSAINFMKQIEARPNSLLIAGAGGLSGTLWESSLIGAGEEARSEFFGMMASPAAYVNLERRTATDRDAARTGGGGGPDDVYLLGDAAALYFLDALGERPAGAAAGTAAMGRRVRYHTTWDASPLGDAIGAAPGDPAAWSRLMRGRGIGWVLINYGELSRLIETDHNFDPRVTVETVRAWVTGGGGLESVRRWTAGAAGERTTHELFRIRAPGGGHEGGEER